MASAEYNTSSFVFLDDIVCVYRGRSTLERFWEKVDKRSDEECWPWLGARMPAGYGSFPRMRNGTRTHYAHQFSYLIAHGSLNKNLTIDHLCRNTSCVNPRHLEQVPQRINMLRGTAPSAYRARQIFCKNGHLFDEANTYIKPNGNRRCRKCMAAHARNYRKTDEWKDWAKNQPKRSIQTHCSQGHLYTEETTRYIHDGKRRCTICFP